MKNKRMQKIASILLAATVFHISFAESIWAIKKILSSSLPEEGKEYDYDRSPSLYARIGGMK